MRVPREFVDADRKNKVPVTGLGRRIGAVVVRPQGRWGGDGGARWRLVRDSVL